MENKINIKVWPPEGKEVIKVYLIDKDGNYITKTGFIAEDFDKKTMIKCDEYEHPTQLKPKWNKKFKKWTEGASKEELSAHLESVKSRLIESNRSEVGMLCSSIASELEQSNWINFPEDYEPSEIEEKKNQIKEIRAKGREIRANIDATQSLEELSELDLNIIPLPEPEGLTE